MYYEEWVKNVLLGRMYYPFCIAVQFFWCNFAKMFEFSKDL